MNGQDLEDILIGEQQTVDLSPLILHKGQNDIHFHVPEGCDVPAETVPGNADLRCLSLLFQDMELSPVQGEAP